MMSKKHSAVLAVILLFCFALCGCVGQVSVEASHSPSNGASVEPSPTVSEEPKPSVQNLNFDVQYTLSDNNLVGEMTVVEHFFEVYSPAVINSYEELEAFYNRYQREIPAEAERYDEAFFAKHSLILFGVHEVDELIWHEVENISLVDGKSIIIEINRMSPEVGDLAEGGYSFYIATDQKLPSDTPIEWKVTDIAILTVKAQYYPAESAVESTLPSAVISSKQELEEYISRYASRDAVFKEAAKEYDDDYFKWKSLLFIQLKESDPLVKPSVECVFSIVWEGKIVVEIEHAKSEETQSGTVYNIFITIFQGPLCGFGADTLIEVTEANAYD